MIVGANLQKESCCSRMTLKDSSSFYLWAETLRRDNSKTDMMIGCESTGHYWFAFVKYIQNR